MYLSNKGLEKYDAKILLAWGESIDGNEKITEWFMKNGYTELGLFHFALRNEPRSREWLMKNGHPHLMALINGIESRKDALTWLKSNGYDILHEMALAADNDDLAFKNLLRPETKAYALLAKKMGFIKNAIEENNRDIHKFDPN